jgi:hypothetical protein
MIYHTYHTIIKMPCQSGKMGKLAEFNRIKPINKMGGGLNASVLSPIARPIAKPA